MGPHGRRRKYATPHFSRFAGIFGGPARVPSTMTDSNKCSVMSDLPDRSAARPTRPAPLTEADLADLKAGKEAAWRHVVDAYGRLVNYAAHQVRLDADEVDDVFQLTFMRASRSVNTLRDPGAFPSWIYQIAHRVALNQLKKRRPDVSVDDPDTEFVADEIAVDPDQLQIVLTDERGHQVREAVRRLPARQRALIEALYLQTPRATYDEVAERLGVPVGSIGPTRMRALAKLKELYTDVSNAGPGGSLSSGPSEMDARTSSEEH